MTNSRRSFLAGAGSTLAGLMFCSCGLLHGRAARAQTPPAAPAVRRSRTRVKTIDVHAHCVIPEALALQSKSLSDQRGRGIGEVGARRIAEMDAAGIDVEALSINPHWYKAEKDLAAEICRINNTKLAEYCGLYPERIVAFASVTLHAPELAVEQLHHAVKKLGLRGAAVGASSTTRGSSRSSPARCGRSRVPRSAAR